MVQRLQRSSHVMSTNNRQRKDQVPDSQSCCGRQTPSFGDGGPFGRPPVPDAASPVTTPGGFPPVNMPLPKGYGDPRSRSDHRSDQQIEDEIKAQLWYCGILNDQPIRIEVTNAEVTLSGNTDALEKKRVAEEAAASISGVVAVHNELDVRIRGHDEDVDTEPASTPEATESD